MRKKEIVAMILAGGQGSRLGKLTKNIAKPAVPFGGKYRIIDFPLSNCSNSGIYTVGVLTQYKPLDLNNHIGIGDPWDLDRRDGGVSILPPYQEEEGGDWYKGTANAIYQNIEYIDRYSPEYVLILSGDHIYKMDYYKMLEFHKENNADAIEVKGLFIDKKRHVVTLYDETVNLTPTEFEILWLLCENAGKVVSSETIFETVWKENYLDCNNTVMVHVRRLREKLKEPSRNPRIIKTVWGVGYKIEK